jgi:hypothetical protein
VLPTGPASAAFVAWRGRPSNRASPPNMNRAKATGVITALAAHRPASARTATQIVAAKRSTRSPLRAQRAASIVSPRMITSGISDKPATAIAQIAIGSLDRLGARDCCTYGGQPATLAEWAPINSTRPQARAKTTPCRIAA